MTISASNRHIWPDEVHKWLLSAPVSGANSAAAKERRYRLASDKRLLQVAKRLRLLAVRPTNPEPIYRLINSFLEIASELPESFGYFKDKTPGFRAREIQELAKTTRRYLKLVESKRDVIERYFEPSMDSIEVVIAAHQSTDPNFEIGTAAQAISMEKDQVDQLVWRLEHIAEYAENGRDSLPPDVHPITSRKAHVGSAEKLFCVRQLSRSARKLFKKPLHKEVGLIVTVCLNSPVEIDSDEVRDICRDI